MLVLIGVGVILALVVLGTAMNEWDKIQANKYLTEQRKERRR